MIINANELSAYKLNIQAGELDVHDRVHVNGMNNFGNSLYYNNYTMRTKVAYTRMRNTLTAAIREMSRYCCTREVNMRPLNVLTTVCFILKVSRINLILAVRKLMPLLMLKTRANFWS